MKETVIARWMRLMIGRAEPAHAEDELACVPVGGKRGCCKEDEPSREKEREVQYERRETRVSICGIHRKEYISVVIGM